ncbi:MAG: divalent-cation tolerance protein CutA [Candidatus Berkiella sp.]
MDTLYRIVLCTCPNQATAVQIAQELTTAGLAACTNIIPDITSIYSWEGKLMEGSEALMFIKTRKDKLADLEQAILAIHPYQTPEFLVMPISAGERKYLTWMDGVMGGPFREED